MKPQAQSTPLFTLLEQSDVFADACISDTNAQLLFLSVYGRDTSLQQLMARLHQPASQGGVESLSLCSSLATPGKAEPPFKTLIGDARRLEKTTGRMPRTGLLGNLAHLWVFDPRLLELDHAARVGWLFELSDATDRVPTAPQDDSAWRLVQELSPVPLLTAWRLAVLRHLLENNAVVQARSIGPAMAFRIELPEGFPAWVSDELRTGRLPFDDRAWARPVRPAPVVDSARA